MKELVVEMPGSMLNMLGLNIENAISLPVPLMKKVQAFLLSCGSWAEAKPLVKALYETSPRGLSERVTLARACARTGEIELAEEMCNELEVELPGKTSVIAARGDLYLEQGDAAAAIGCYRRILEIDPLNWEAWVLIARVCQRAGRWNEAEGYTRKATAACLNRNKREGFCLPNSLLRILERQALGCGRTREAESIRSEIEKRISESAKALRNLLDAYKRGIEADSR